MGGAFAAGDGGEPGAADEEPATRFALGKTLGTNGLRLLETTGGGMWGRVLRSGFYGAMGTDLTRTFWSVIVIIAALESIRL